jgi:microcystin-dependent protein
VGYGTIPLGGIIMWSGTTIPDGWALCNGQLSNGYTTPDLRGRFIVGYGANGTSVPDNVWDTNYRQPGDLSQKGTTTGTIGGEKQHQLTDNEIPAHAHDLQISNVNSEHSDSGHDYYPAQYIQRDAWTLGGVDKQWSGNTNYTGGSQPHENRPPYYVLALIMRVK